MFKNIHKNWRFVAAIAVIALAIVITTIAPFATASTPAAIGQDRTAAIELEQLSVSGHPSTDFQKVAQIFGVSQITDVKPTDYYFNDLRSLVERYGCARVYPDGTYRGEQPLTRGDFAVMLNQCLGVMQELIRQAAER